MTVNSYTADNTRIRTIAAANHIDAWTAALAEFENMRCVRVDIHDHQGTVYSIAPRDE